MSELRTTPLTAFAIANGGRMVDFAGWNMPVQFESIVEEHKATRSAAGLFDVSHMGEARVEGLEATRFLDHVLTNDISGMSIGQALYSLMCYENGGVVDDLLVYKLGEESYLLCLNAANTEKDLEWLNTKRSGFDVSVANVSDSYALLALQGPKAFPILESIAPGALDGLKYYHFREGELAGAQCIVSRTGYTGEPGVEIFVSPEPAESLAKTLVAAGTDLGLRLAGLGSRDSLRLEAGYSLYGHEISETITPVQANLMWTVKLGKASDFIGKAALAEEKAAGPKKRIVFFKTGNRRIVRSGTLVLTGDREAGVVVSGTFSPELNEAIGSAWVDSDAANAQLSVDMRGKELQLFSTKPPFITLNPQSNHTTSGPSNST